MFSNFIEILLYILSNHLNSRWIAYNLQSICSRYFRKESRNEKLILYLINRDLIVNNGKIDKLFGVIKADPEYIKNKRVSSFRIDIEMMHNGPHVRTHICKTIDIDIYVVHTEYQECIEDWINQMKYSIDRYFMLDWMLGVLVGVRTSHFDLPIWTRGWRVHGNKILHRGNNLLHPTVSSMLWLGSPRAIDSSTGMPEFSKIHLLRHFDKLFDLSSSTHLHFIYMLIHFQARIVIHVRDYLHVWILDSEFWTCITWLTGICDYNDNYRVSSKWELLHGSSLLMFFITHLSALDTN